MDQQHIDQATVAPSSSTANCDPVEVLPPCFKLIVDCWEDILHYLAMEDVHAMGQTCKRMNQLAGHYIREYYPQLLFVLMNRRIRTIDSSNIQLRPEFYPFISDLLIRDQLDYSLNAKTFAAVKTLAFNASEITEHQVQHCQSVLGNVENVLLYDCTTDAGDIFRQFAVLCPKLKYLDLKNCHEPNAVFRKVFLHHFPSLERMKYELYPWNEAQQINELKPFLEKHVQLNHFECDDRFLWANRNLLIQTNVKLERLSIYLKTPEIAMQFDHFIGILRQMQERGFYKTIHFTFDLYYDYDNYGPMINGIATLPTTIGLNIDVLASFGFLSGLINLTDLRIGELSHLSTELEVETTIKYLTKLQHLTIDEANVANILPFVRHSKMLKSIRILELNDHSLNLFALNLERKKLENSQKIVIQVPENVYLNEKWQWKNSNLSHIVIERFLAFKPFLRS